MNSEFVLLTEYMYGLGSFLDEKNIKWKQAHIDEVGDFITIYLRNTSPSDIWNLAIEFKRWQEKLDDTY